MVIWPGAQDLGLQAAHVPALSQRSLVCKRETRNLKVAERLRIAESQAQPWG